MTGKTHTVSFERFGEEFETAVEWFASVGVPVAPTRLGTYRRAIHELLAAQASGDFTSLDGRLREILTAFYEAHELLYAHGAVPGAPLAEHLAERVRLVAGGPTAYSDEVPSNSSNRARNLAFEMIVARRFAAAGLEMLPAKQPDVGVVVGGRAVLFECKRPQSAAAIERCVHDARRQLRERYKSDRYRRPRGIIALELTKVVNPEFGTISAMPSAEVGGHLKDALFAFFRTHQPLWDQLGDDRTLGVLARISVMAECPDVGAYVYAQQFQLGQFTEKASDLSVLAALADAFERTNEFTTVAAGP